MEAMYVILGIVIGVIGLFAIAFYSSKKDNDKFDPTEKKESNIGGFWPEGFQTESSTWKSTTETRFTTVRESKKKKEKSLEVQLKEALENEEYEIAAKLRDKINAKSKTTK